MSATDIYLCPNTPYGPTDIILRLVAPCLGAGATPPSGGGGVFGTIGAPPLKRIERFGSVEGVTDSIGAASGIPTVLVPLVVGITRSSGHAIGTPNMIAVATGTTSSRGEVRGGRDAGTENRRRRRREEELLCVV